MLKAILSISFIVVIIFAHAQENSVFEGKIFLSKYTLTDTLHAILIVKNNKIRLDELNKNNTLKKYTLLDINGPEIYAFNAQRKLYTMLPVHPWSGDAEKKFEVLKTGNYKEILGYKCFQWIVKNKEKNTEVTYWVEKEHFPFFYKMMQLLNINENTSQFFLEIPEAENVFPLLTVERSLLREWKSKIVITDIQKEPIEDSIFDIPKDYELFEK